MAQLTADHVVQKVMCTCFFFFVFFPRTFPPMSVFFSHHRITRMAYARACFLLLVCGSAHTQFANESLNLLQEAGVLNSPSKGPLVFNLNTSQKLIFCQILFPFLAFGNLDCGAQHKIAIRPLVFLKVFGGSLVDFAHYCRHPVLEVILGIYLLFSRLISNSGACYFNYKTPNLSRKKPDINHRIPFLGIVNRPCDYPSSGKYQAISTFTTHQSCIWEI